MAIQLELCSEEAIKTGVVELLLSQWDEEHRVNFIARSPRCPKLSRIQTKAECQRLHRAWDAGLPLAPEPTWAGPGMLRLQETQGRGTCVLSSSHSGEVPEALHVLVRFYLANCTQF